MTKASGKVSVVTVNYNSQRLVVKCLSSLKRNVSQELILIVVDNSEQDETDKIRENHPDAVFIHSGENKGFAAGCNVGMRAAVELGAQYILLLNPDTFAQDDFITPLLETMDQNENIGIASPTIVFPGKVKKAWYAGAKMNWWLKGPVHLKYQFREKQSGPVEVPFVSGCAMFIRLKALQDVGYMDEDFFLYFEDADYCQKMISAGWKLIFVPQAFVCHDLSSSVGVQSKQAVYYISRNRVWFMRRWAKWYHLLVFMTYNTLVKLPCAVIIFGLLRGKPELVKSYFKGYIDGLK